MTEHLTVDLGKFGKLEVHQNSELTFPGINVFWVDPKGRTQLVSITEHDAHGGRIQTHLYDAAQNEPVGTAVFLDAAKLSARERLDYGLHESTETT